jgi:hypothetical protein
MKSIVRLIVCLCILFGCGNKAIQSALAQQQPLEPVINIVAKDEPLLSALNSISRQTGYQFKLSPKWEKHPVSATIDHQPLDKGLKRLLKSLNHTILWEADKSVIIKVYGKAAPRSSGGISFAAPPQEVQEEDEPSIESDDEPLDENDETDETDQKGKKRLLKRATDRRPASPGPKLKE